MNYTCNECLKTKEGKAWISIQDKENVIRNCSYLCYKRHLVHIPKKHFHLILNLEDFNEPRPVFIKPTKQEFQFLTETEINELSNEQYHNYKDDLDEQFLLNPIQSEVYHTGLLNDKHVRELEEEGDDELLSEEEVGDDY